MLNVWEEETHKSQGDVGTELRSDSAEVTESGSTSEDKEQTVTASSMMQQASGIMCTKLNDTNYMSWSFKMEIYLRRESLWQYVENPPDDNEGCANNGKARATITLCLEDSQVTYVRNLKTSQECWQALRNIYA